MSETKIDRILCEKAANPLGNYSHAVGVGEWLYICGMGPRHPVTDKVPGLELGTGGEILRYDIRRETEQTLENIRIILEESGSDLSRVVEVCVYLRNMVDFSAMNEVYARYFPENRPVRTTIGVVALPGPISVEMKAVAIRKWPLTH